MQSAEQVIGWPESEPDGDEMGPGSGFAEEASLPPTPGNPVGAPTTPPQALVQQLASIVAQLTASLPPAPETTDPIPFPDAAPAGAEMMV